MAAAPRAADGRMGDAKFRGMTANQGRHRAGRIAVFDRAVRHRDGVHPLQPL